MSQESDVKLGSVWLVVVVKVEAMTRSDLQPLVHDDVERSLCVVRHVEELLIVFYSFKH